MANKEVVTVLTVKTEQSQNTIKGLKQEIADLKKKLDSAVIGTDEFERASKELATAQANLKTVLADGKKTTDAVEGSYNHLVATMAELKKQWRATADEVKRNELGQQIDNINTQLKELDASTGNFQRNVGDYANQFKEAFEEQQQSTENVIIGLDGLQKTAAGLASGYAAVQGAMNLLNIENSDFEKAMIKVQSAMAIAQGVGGMKDLIEGAGTLKVMFNSCITSVKGFITGLSGVKKAIAATGIGLLVTALGTLVVYWDDVTAAVKRWTGAMYDGAEKVDEILSKQGKLSSNAIRMQKELNRELAIMKAEGKTDLEIAQKKLELSEQIYNEQKAYVDSLEKQYNYSKWQKDQGVPLTDFAKEVLEKYPEMIEKGKELTESYRQNWLDARNEIKVINITTAKEEAAEEERIAKESADKKVVAVEDRANRQKEIEEEIRVSKLTEEEKLYDDLEKKYKEYIEVFKNDKEKQKEIFDWYCDEYLKIVEKELDSEINAIEEANKKKKELEEANYSDRVALSEKRLDKKIDTIDKTAENAIYINERKKPDDNGELAMIENELSKLETLKTIIGDTTKLKIDAIQIEQAMFEESSARWKELEEQKKQIKEDTNRTLLELDEQYIEQSKAKNRVLAGSITNTFTASLQAASSIMSALQEGLDTTTKEGFEKNKKVQIANAIIQTLVGVTTALSGAFTTKSGPWDIALAAIQASTIAANGAIQVANIRKQTFEGSESSAIATPSINLADSMPIQYTRELMTDSETTNLNKEQRVYVLESDITDTQENVKVKESNSSF